MKKVLLCVTFFAFSTLLCAQSTSEKTLVERITKMEKKSDAFRVQVHLRGALNTYINDEPEAVKFALEDFRLDIQGDITKNIYYWYRQSMNRNTDGSGNFDNAQSSLNVAGVGIRLKDFNIFMGRQFVAYGGYEYDYAPLDVYQFSNIINNIVGYLTGVEVAYNGVKGQQFKLQVTDTYATSFEKTYGTVPLHIDKARVPLQYTVNWNGSFFDGKYKTRWSATYASVAKSKENYFYAAGNELTFGKFNMYADLYYSKEDIDSRTIMSEFSQAANKDETSALDANYLGVVARINYTVHPQWRIMIKGIYDTASTSKDRGNLKKGLYSSTYGYLAGFEFTPFLETPFRLFAYYCGQSVKNTAAAKALNFGDHSKDRVSVGFVYRLPVF